MRTRLRHWWEVISSGYWFVPAVMSAAAAAAAWTLLYLDRALVEPSQVQWGLYSGGADGARALLAAIAGSVVTVASVVFSITIAALTQASSQFGPRLLRNFMRDRGNQFVLGTFVSTFIYCLLILRMVRGRESEGFVPHLSVTFAVLLAVVSTAVLIYYIHHVSMSLQAPVVIAAVAADLGASVAEATGKRAPQAEMDGQAEAIERELAAAEGEAIASPRDGYVQAIDYAALVEEAEKADVVVRLAERPGDFVMEKNPLLRAHPPGRLDERARRKMAEAFIIGRERTREQDVEYAIRQLVEVAVRALSSGINDPFTAMNCVDVLGASLCRIARHPLTPRVHLDQKGKPRVFARLRRLAEMLDAAFTLIRHATRTSPSVMVRMLEVIGSIARQIKDPAATEALRRQAEMILDDGLRVMTQERIGVS